MAGGFVKATLSALVPVAAAVVAAVTVVVVAMAVRTVAVGAIAVAPCAMSGAGEEADVMQRAGIRFTCAILMRALLRPTRVALAGGVFSSVACRRLRASAASGMVRTATAAFRVTLMAAAMTTLVAAAAML